MENELKNQENAPREETQMTRRKLLQISAVGALIAVTGLHVAYRRSRPHPFGLTEITIEGPFKEYGYFKPEDLGREDIRRLRTDFVLEQVCFSEGKYYDEVFISFTFAGIEDTDRKMNVSLIVYDTEGMVIGGAEQIFDDPRILSMSMSEMFSGFYVSRYSTLTARLKSGKNKSKISCIGKIVLNAIELS